MDQETRIQYQVRLSRAFRPGAPIDSKALFSGRDRQVTDVINAVFQPGQHVIMFGERGVGKTSLARSLADILKDACVTPLSSGTVNCDGTDNFAALWRKVFRELQVVVKMETIGFSTTPEERPINLESFLPEGDVSPDDVRYAIVQAAQMAARDRKVLIVLDEVDRITNRTVTTLLADTVKTLSDHLVPVTLIMVGVADAVQQLIGEHRSIERSLVQVPMPRMSRAELLDVIQKGFEQAQMSINIDAREKIIRLSQGLPHFTHLLSMESAHAALAAERTDVLLEDVISATRSAVEKSHTLANDYRIAVSSSQSHSLFEEVLLACVLAQKDELGWFPASNVVGPMSILRERHCPVPYFARHLDQFSSKGRGGILKKGGTKGRYQYKFENPLLEVFTLIRSISNGMWPKEDSRAVANPD